MKIVITRMVNGMGFGAGRVEFYHGAEVIHTEEFQGRVTGDRHEREVDVPEDARAVFVVVDGEFVGHIED